MAQIVMLVPLGEMGAVDPGYGRPGGGGHPDQSLPWAPGHPSHGLPGQGGHPGHGLPEGPPAHPWLPGMIDGRPDNTLPLPPVDGTPPPPAGTKPPLGIWPPLPPSVSPGLHAILVWISGLGYRYAIVEVAQPKA